MRIPYLTRLLEIKEQQILIEDEKREYFRLIYQKLKEIERRLK